MKQTMSRRDFMRCMGKLTALAVLPWELANPKSLAAKELQASILGQINYQKPAIMPKVILIFLYGGPSELAGNLTNIEEINKYSQNKYPDNILPTKANYTSNGFWKTAGGDAMESLIASQDLSIYRTINRRKDDNKAHELSILQNLVGNPAKDGPRPGIGTVLAAVLAANKVFNAGVLLPFVSFEGNSVTFQPWDDPLPSELKVTSIDSGFKNPYSRSNNSFLNNATLGSQDSVLEILSRKISSALGPTYEKMNEAFNRRAILDNFITTNFSKSIVDSRLPAEIVYPNTSFGNRLKAAMALAIDSPDTVFIGLGGAGLGGWDDHSASITTYANRMKELMDAISMAAQHMKAKGRNDIIINIFGDFGRNVNLNDSLGWDHGNNQNLYTIGGSAVRPGALGKIVGKTMRIGTAFENRQFTSPIPNGSYQCEPFSIASSIYKYFGIQNPEILTGEAPIDELGQSNEKV